MFQQLRLVSQWERIGVRLGWAVKSQLIALAGLLCVATQACAAAEFDFAALRSVIETRQVNSVEELVPLLPVALRSRYALVFSSRSLQQATYSAPRVILYGSDAHLVLTFNGDASQRGFNTVETLEFGQDKQFRLREIRFPAPGSKEAVSFSAPNPTTGQACHGSPAAPVWDSWPLWPGAYGQRYDAPLAASERAGLESFLAQQASHPRYGQLMGIQRLADPATFHDTQSQRYSGVHREPPNAELGALLDGLAVESLVRQMRERPGFSTYQYALLGLADGDCGAVADFVPAAARGAALTGLRRLADVSAVANRWALTFKEQRLHAESVVAVSPAAALVPLRLVAEAGLSMNTDTWTLALEKGTYDFTPSPGTRPTLRDALLAEIAGQDPTLEELGTYATSADGDRYCRYLQRRSQAALSSRNVAAAADWSLADRARPTGLQPQQVLRICAGCHESGVAPHIPFLQEAALRQALLSESKPRARLLDEVLFRLSPDAAAGRMPLGTRLSDQERGELERYFVALVAPTR